jgi:hypothetical protein
VSLIDLASLEVVKETRTKANVSRASIGVAQSTDAWDALTPKGKIRRAEGAHRRACAEGS